jgi:thiamine biosynthesis lipoprotein
MTRLIPWLLRCVCMITLAFSARGLAQQKVLSVLPAELPAATAKQLPTVFQRDRAIMGTIFEITVVGTPTPVAEKAITAALNEIARLEEILSEWREGSEITHINRAAGTKPIPVSPDTWAVLHAGQEVSKWSRGAFDMSWAALRELYLFQPGQQTVPSKSQIKDRLHHVGYRDIVLNPHGPSVLLRHKRMQIGTGGIAKGYALDRAAAILRAASVENFTVYGGGQVQVSGARGPRPWRVGIQHPRKNDYVALMEVPSGTSVSTSGDYEHVYIDPDGKRWHHIIDPRTGLPSEKSVSATVLTPSGIHADALSTACFVLGPSGCLQMIAKLPFHAEAVIIGPDLTVHATPQTRKKLIFRMPVQGNQLVD